MMADLSPPFRLLPLFIALMQYRHAFTPTACRARLSDTFHSPRVSVLSVELGQQVGAAVTALLEGSCEALAKGVPQ